MTVPVNRQRAKKPKTRTGCRTCKRIKCDEARPACRKCSSSGRECGGYEVPAAHLPGSECIKRPLLPISRSYDYAPLFVAKRTIEPSSPYAAREWYAVDFFRGQSVFQLPGCSMVNSWETLALRLSHSEPAIRSAIIALGSMHRARGLEPPNKTSPTLEPEQYSFALQHYARAVSDVQKRLTCASPGQRSENVEVTLLACLMFMTFELLQGSYGVALQHRAIGVKILGEHVAGYSRDTGIRPKIRLKPRPSSAIDILSQAFVCVDYDLSMSGSLVPELYATIEDQSSPPAFETPDEARLHLNVLVNSVYRVRSQLEEMAKQEMIKNRIMPLKLYETDRGCCWNQSRSLRITLDDYPELEASMSAVEGDIAGWSSSFACMPPPVGEAEKALRMLLQIQFLHAWVLTATWRSAPETRYDRFLPVFSNTVNNIEHLLTLRPNPERPDIEQQQGEGSVWRLIGRGTGSILALHLIATKCRDSAVRWKAVSLLDRIKLQEGLLSSVLLAPCTEQVVVLEEQWARRMNGMSEKAPLRCSDVPEEARIIEVSINANSSNLGIAGLVYSTCSPEWPGFVMDEHWFSVVKTEA
ncbi:uncharacterized protein LTR77_009258 [Saxophila tyrrhenica]|uniref:Zn(2)-C6 fungal-type domain-containing protein n=1 Tax=Saxophila tyrrhenica TaxID=1690608 RepID=A0AAV9NZ64_9PEZI|nr:hypothetical protein LTR77_009258 [Saxophila tyrrhenica]